MKQIILALLIVLGILSLNLSTLAQTENVVVNNIQNALSNEAVKVDEFGRVGNCDLGARLDHLVIRSQENPTSKIYIIAYQGVDVLPSEYNNSRAARYYERYLTQNRGISSDKFTIVTSFREQNATEFWIVPEGATPPEPTDIIPAPEIPKGKTYLYTRSYVGVFTEDFSENPFSREFLLPHVLEREKAEEAEIEASYAEVEESMNSSEQQTAVEPIAEVEEEKISAEELESIRFSWVNERFAEAVKNEKNSRGVILFYADDQHYDIAKLQTYLEEGKAKIAASRELSADKFELVFGGYKHLIQLEMWVVPAGKEMPTATPEERPIEEPEVVETENN
jgi:hypothetical protein